MLQCRLPNSKNTFTFSMEIHSSKIIIVLIWLSSIRCSYTRFFFESLFDCITFLWFSYFFDGFLFQLGRLCYCFILMMVNLNNAFSEKIAGNSFVDALVGLLLAINVNVFNNFIFTSTPCLWLFIDFLLRRL